MDRSKLPFRLNCEGYFLTEDGMVLAKDSNNGFLGFPGGGIDEEEDITKGLIRETYEETGAIVKNLKSLGRIKLIWGKNWAKTDKQRKRYEQFQGDEMYFFTGDIKKFDEGHLKIGEEDLWDGEKLISLKDAIKFIEKTKPFDVDIKAYREAQVKFLKELLKQLSFQKTL